MRVGHDTARWYPIAEPPPQRVLVRLIGVRGHMLDGWRDARNLHGVVVPWWFERRGRVMAPLERVLPQPVGRLSPTAWQPIDEAAWRYPLPRPLDATYGPRWVPHLPPRISESEPPADAALASFEARMLMAFQVDHALPDTERSKLRVRSTWPATRPGPGDYPPEAVTRFRPTREQIADYLVVMKFVALLTRRQIKVVRLRAAGYGFHWIAKGIDTDEQNARRIYRQARLDCWRHAVRAGAG